MAGQPKAPFWLTVWAVILGLVALAAWRAGMLDQFGLGRPAGGGGNAAARQAGPAGGGPVGAGDGPGQAGGGATGSGTGGDGVLFEAGDSAVPTTVKE